jgi:molecular chaperone IbpA
MIARSLLADLPKFFVGFDRLEQDFFASTVDGSYPRYNIVQTGEHGYRIEVAVPGWDRKDIEISLFKNVLSVKGTRKQVENPDETYAYKGLSGKQFTRDFKVGDYIKIEKAYLERGLLCLNLVQDLPESERPVTIAID